MPSKARIPKKRILWFNWKDWQHPQAGGAELVMRELCRRLVADGHEVTLLTAQYPGSTRHDTLEGTTVIRIGRNRYLHSFQALWYYLRHLRDQYDVIVEVVNTAPYFATLYAGTAKPVLFYHQLAREIWYHETKWPLNAIGYHLLEPLATRRLGRSGALTLSVSNSTTKDLERFGFQRQHIAHITEGIRIAPLKKLTDAKKYDQPTLLSLGAVRAMKQTLDQVKAFELAKQHIPELRLKLAGSTDGAYGQKVLDYVAASPYAADIEVLGRFPEEHKAELMQQCHLLLVTSLKEGWCLVVSEANSQGTPAVVYDADGLRDSVRHNDTGLVCAPNPAALADGVVNILSNTRRYNTIRRHAYTMSLGLTFDHAYTDFVQAVF